MKRRQTVPRQWLVADSGLGNAFWPTICQLPPGSGVLLLFHGLPSGSRARLVARLRRVAKAKGLVIADEASGEAARVHNLAQVRAASLKRTPLLFLSPIFPTQSHPGWRAIPPMRAAALARRARAPVIALGGMNAERFSRIERLGFQGWAGISAWIRT